jgi:AcrR family transcriptional regulator
MARPETPERRPLQFKDSTLQEQPRKRRARRSSRETIDSILSAASEEFERHGYAGATTSAIARAANVSEPLIFSNFGSKADLFQASIFEPLNAHLVEFCSRHLTEGERSDENWDLQRREYIAELQAFIAQHSRKLVSLFFMQTYGKETQGLDEIEGIQDYLNAAAAMTSPKSKGKQRIRPAVLARISFITILSSIIFKDWLFKNEDISREELFASLTDFLIDGLNANSRA